MSLKKLVIFPPKYISSSDHLTQEKFFVVCILALILCLPRKNISYPSITDRPQTFNIVAGRVEIICFDLANNLRGLKLLQNYCITKLYQSRKSYFLVF